MTQHAYERLKTGRWRRIHANGEETHVRVAALGDTHAVVAFDVDPREYAAVAAECVAYTRTTDEARGRALAWMEQHPRGVADDAAGGQGFGSKLMGALKKLDQSATPTAKGDGGEN